MFKLLRILVFVIAALVAIAFGLSIFLSPDDLSQCLRNNTCLKVDAIVVISGGDTNARAQEGINLFNKNLADYIIFSGAAADKTGPSNAEAMREIAVQHGVPKNQILMDINANNTNENAEYVQKIAEKYDFESIILITSPYHQRRAHLEFQRALGTNFMILNHPTSHDSGWSKVWWLSPRGWWLAVSEAVKIIIFFGSAG